MSKKKKIITTHNPDLDNDGFIPPEKDRHWNKRMPIPLKYKKLGRKNIRRLFHELKREHNERENI